MTRARELARLGNENAISANSDNKVGIGSTQPAAKLDVKGDVDVSQGVSVTGILTVTGSIDAAGGIDGGVNATGIVTASHGLRATAGGINIISGVSTFANQVDANGSVYITGIVTASHGVRVTAGGINVTAGITTVTDFKATGNFPVTPDSGTGVGATVGKGDSGITTYYGDGSNLDGVTGGGGLGTAISYDVAGTTSPFSYIDREVNVTENMDLTNTNAGLNSSIIVSVIPQVTVLNGIAVTVGAGKTMVIDILQIADV